MKHSFFILTGMTELQFALAVSVMGKAQTYWDTHPMERDKEDSVRVPIAEFSLQERGFIKDKYHNPYVQAVVWSPMKKKEPEILELVQPL